jgi:hypothetical protein
MATNVTGSTNLIIGLTRTITGGSMSTPVDSAAFTFPNVTFSSGTAGGSLEEEFHGTVSVVGTNVTTIDLSDTNGAGLVMGGSPIAFTKVKQFWVRHANTNVTDVITATFNGTNGWTAWCNGTLKLNPGQPLGFCDSVGLGFAVTAGTNEKVSFVSSGTNTISLDLMIGGNKS